MCDFDAMLRHDWRRLGISAEEVREFCVWRVLSLQGDLVDSYRTCFLAFDGHCYVLLPALAPPPQHLVLLRQLLDLVP